MEKSHQPLINDVTVEITNRCQLRCRHCGIWAEEGSHEIRAARFVSTLRELLARYRIHSVSLTGGEPFLNKDCGRFIQALALFRNKGDIRSFGLYSNAACFEPICRVLTTSRAAVDGMHLGISLDGHEATHDRLRGEGAYAKTLKTIGWIRENFGQRIVLEIKFTINRLNYAQLQKMYDLARHVQAGFSPKLMESQVPGYYHRHPMPEVNQLSSLTPRMVEHLHRVMTLMLKDGYPGIDVSFVEATRRLLHGGVKSIRACATPAHSLFITSRGEVYPCLYLPSAGKIGKKGQLPRALDGVRAQRTQDAATGRCPRCFAYHGFLKKYNLAYLSVEQ